MVRRSYFLFRKYLFLVLALGISGIGVFLTGKLIYEAHVDYKTAFAAAKETGIYIQELAGVVNRLQLSEGKENFQQFQARISHVAKQLGTSHINHTSGLTTFGSNGEFAWRLKEIYNEEFARVENQMVTLLTSANTLASMRFKRKHHLDPAYLRIQTAANGGVLLAVGNIIQQYRSLVDKRTSNIVMFWFLGQFLIVAGSVIWYVFARRSVYQERDIPRRDAADGSVSNVLGGLTVFPGDAEGGMDLVREQNLVRQ